MDIYYIDDVHCDVKKSQSDKKVSMKKDKNSQVFERLFKQVYKKMHE